jgi:hypothetical protein
VRHRPRIEGDETRGVARHLVPRLHEDRDEIEAVGFVAHRRILGVAQTVEVVVVEVGQEGRTAVDAPQVLARIVRVVDQAVAVGIGREIDVVDGGRLDRIVRRVIAIVVAAASGQRQQNHGRHHAQTRWDRHGGPPVGGVQVLRLRIEVAWLRAERPRAKRHFDVVQCNGWCVSGRARSEMPRTKWSDLASLQPISIDGGQPW